MVVLKVRACRPRAHTTPSCSRSRPSRSRRARWSSASTRGTRWVRRSPPPRGRPFLVWERYCLLQSNGLGHTTCAPFAEHTTSQPCTSDRTGFLSGLGCADGSGGTAGGPGGRPLGQPGRRRPAVRRRDRPGASAADLLLMYLGWYELSLCTRKRVTNTFIIASKFMPESCAQWGFPIFQRKGFVLVIYFQSILYRACY